MNVIRFFDDNYCKRHEQYCEKLQGHDQEDTAGTRGEDEEKNKEKGKLSGMK